MHVPSRARKSAALVFSCGLALILSTGASKPGRPEAAASDEARGVGRDLFARPWVPNDTRAARGGDGLGPVFNARSCLACHDRGGPGGAGAAGQNIEIATAVGLDAGFSGYGFAYAFGMDLSAGRFEYKIASDPAPSKRRPTPLDPAALASIHPGFPATRSVVLHRFGTDAAYHAWRAAVPGPHGPIRVVTSLRNPTPLFGTGLIDAIPEEAIEAASRPRPGGAGAAAAARIKGRVSRLADGRVGRFGWKAQTATLREFVVSAAATEIGLEVPGRHQAADPRLPGLGAPGLDMDETQCDALTAYVRGLPAPVARVPADAAEAAQVKAGEGTFKAIGCAGCHLPALGGVDGLYTDLLLHDMSPRLGDTAAYGVFATNAAGADGPAAADPRGEAALATTQEWRTPPLWGLRDSAPYLHDGRAATLDQAITLHGGQAAASAQRYAQVSARRKRQLEGFLLSLSAPPLEDPRPGLAQAP